MSLKTRNSLAPLGQFVYAQGQVRTSGKKMSPRPAPAMSQIPELPEPAGVVVVGTQAMRAFTADQMRQFYQQGVEAGRGAMTDAAYSAISEALALGLDYANEHLAVAVSLYKRFPPEGLGRHIVRAEKEVRMFNAAIAALGMP